MKLSCKSIFVVLTFSLIGSTAFAADRVPVFVSIVPQKYFVQQIGKEWVDVQVMVLPGASPATYEPKPDQMAGLAKAKIYFAIGVPFEKVWLPKIAAANPAIKVVPTDQGIEKPGNDPHIWLSPPLVRIQARAIMTALKEADPGHANEYESNYRQSAGRWSTPSRWRRTGWPTCGRWRRSSKRH